MTDNPTFTKSSEGWVKPISNDAEIVDIIAVAIGQEPHPSLGMQAYAALTALQSAGYKVVKE